MTFSKSKCYLKTVFDVTLLSCHVGFLRVVLLEDRVSSPGLAILPSLIRNSIENLDEPSRKPRFASHETYNRRINVLPQIVKLRAIDVETRVNLTGTAYGGHFSHL